MKNKILVFMICLLLSFTCSASSLDEVFRGDQKYYVVAAVLTIIFTGIVVFLVALEKRLKKLEK